MSNYFRSLHRGKVRQALIVMLTFCCSGLACNSRQERNLVGELEEKEFTNTIGTRLVPILPGKFVMGSPLNEEGRFEDEHQHVVEITKCFYIGAHTVTVGEFRQFVTASGYQTDAEKTNGGCGLAEGNFVTERRPFDWKYVGWNQTERHPVVNVSWNDAVAFCKWLSEKENRTYRLPTEAEWEYACRAGTGTAYSCGDDMYALKEFANTADQSLELKMPGWGGNWWDDGFPFTAPVGSFRANAFGLYDMHGNIWQWCEDWYAEYSHDKNITRDPNGPWLGSFRVFRGGTFSNPLQFCRSAFRRKNLPSYRFYCLGFRVACNP